MYKDVEGVPCLSVLPSFLSFCLLLASTAYNCWGNGAATDLPRVLRCWFLITILYIYCLLLVARSLIVHFQNHGTIRCLLIQTKLKHFGTLSGRQTRLSSHSIWHALSNTKGSTKSKDTIGIWSAPQITKSIFFKAIRTSVTINPFKCFDQDTSHVWSMRI